MRVVRYFDGSKASLLKGGREVAGSAGEGTPGIGSEQKRATERERDKCYEKAWPACFAMEESHFTVL